MFGTITEREPEDLQSTCQCCCHKQVHMCDPDTWDCEHCQQPNEEPNWERVFDRTFIVIPLRIKVGEVITPNEDVKKFIKLHQMDMARKFMHKVEERFKKLEETMQPYALWDSESFLNELDHVLDEMTEHEKDHGV